MPEVSVQFELAIFLLFILSVRLALRQAMRIVHLKRTFLSKPNAKDKLFLCDGLMSIENDLQGD